MPEDLAEKVISILASVKHIPREKITLESSLADLGFDSLHYFDAIRAGKRVSNLHPG